MKTILGKRVLWHDGHITFNADQLMEYILNGGEITNKIHVEALNQDIIRFNDFNPSLTVNVKRDLEHLDHTWNVPDEYKKLSINDYVKKKFVELIDIRDKSETPLTDDEVNNRIDRIKLELDLYKKHDMFIILKTIIYIVDVFKRNGVIWGTGRGSSCASYILYLIGLHSVDSVKYELDINEFFK